MRYRAGTLMISEHTDVPIIRTVYQAGHLTIRQLYQCLYPVAAKNRWDSFNRRIRNLTAHGYLQRISVEGVVSDVLSLAENGELLLSGREQLLAGSASRANGKKKRDQIWHDLELFE